MFNTGINIGWIGPVVGKIMVEVEEGNFTSPPVITFPPMTPWRTLPTERTTERSTERSTEQASYPPTQPSYPPDYTFPTQPPRTRPPTTPPFSPNVKLINPDEFTISNTESSWLSSWGSIGVLFGGPLAYILGNFWSRNKSILLASSPFLITYLLFAFWQSLYPYYVGRFLAGLATGMSFGIAPMYASEIASVEIRGFIGTIWVIEMGIGTFLAYVMIPYMTLLDANLVYAAFAVLQFACCFYLPESPHLLLLKNRPEEARAVLMKLRGTEKIEEEFRATAEYVQSQYSETVSIISVFRDPVKRYGALLSCLTMVAQQGTGIAALLTYSQNIFEPGAQYISTNACGIVYGFFQVLPIFTTGYFVEKFGRKLLLVLSSGLCAIPLTILGIYFYCEEKGYSGIESWGLAPFIAMLVQILLYSWGVGALPYIYMSELFSSNIRPIGSLMLVVISAAINGACVQIFNVVDRNFGMYTGFWIFALFTLFCSILLHLSLFETKGKTFAEIQELLSRKTYSKNKYEIESM